MPEMNEGVLLTSENRAYLIGENFGPFLIVAVRYTSPGGPMFVAAAAGPDCAYYLISPYRRSRIMPEKITPKQLRSQGEIRTIHDKVSMHEKSFKAYFVSKCAFRVGEAGLVIGYGIEWIPGIGYTTLYYVFYKDGEVVSVSGLIEGMMCPEYKIPSDQRLSWNP